MIQNWNKKGLIFSPDNTHSWMHSHCQLPTVDYIGGDLFRVYFASRSKQNISNIGYVELDITNPDKSIYVSEDPVLTEGQIGCFDQFGVYPSCVVNYDNKKYLYYIGWVRGCTPPLFYASIGLAISEDAGKTYKKYSNAPIMSVSEYDPCLVTSPHVFLDNGVWRMNYVSGIKWENIDGELKSFYHIKYAESIDGINWKREGKVSIDFKNSEERNVARPCVLKEDGIYKMWFSYVEGQLRYRMGYAESLDGLTWNRKDENIELNIPFKGFDSEMTCYPAIITHKGKKYMFYNGNNFGKEGIGLAIEEYYVK